MKNNEDRRNEFRLAGGTYYIQKFLSFVQEIVSDKEMKKKAMEPGKS